MLLFSSRSFLMHPKGATIPATTGVSRTASGFMPFQQHRLGWIEALLQGQAGLGLAKSQDARAVGQFEEQHFDLAFLRITLSQKPTSANIPRRSSYSPQIGSSRPVPFYG